MSDTVYWICGALCLFHFAGGKFSGHEEYGHWFSSANVWAAAGLIIYALRQGV